MTLFTLFLVTFLLLTPATDAISISTGEQAPGFTLRSVEGKSHSLSEYKGSATVLIYWRTDHKRSLLALRDSNEVLNKFKNKNVKILSIIADSEDRESAIRVMSENQISFPLIIDKDRQIYSSYGIRVYPTTMVIDKEGMLATSIPSHPLTYKKLLEGHLKSTLGEIDESALKEIISPRKKKEDKETLEAHRLYNLAMKFTESGLYDMAVSTAKKAVDAKPGLIDSHVLLDFLYLEVENAEDALNTFTRALEIDPGSNDAKTGLGGALVMNGDVDKAIEVLKPATIANPYPQMTYYELGSAYEVKGDFESSMKMYKKAIEKIIKKNILPSSVSKCR